MISFSICYAVLLIITREMCLTAGFTLEEKLQLFEGKLERLTVKTSSMEVKINRLEVESIKLKAEVTQLKRKVQQQHSLLVVLQNKGINSETELEQESIKKATNKVALRRTCREIRATDPSLLSGDYWIDPDGELVGDDPINVYCNMTTGSTSVYHNSETKIAVEHCSGPGCYSRPIKYPATTRQIIALSELSNECHQSIKYDCTSAPFEANHINYGWWNDRDGNPQYFWSGGNSSVHTCQCGINQNCVEARMSCNCDSSLPTSQVDTGIITNKNILPVTRLNFGRSKLNSSSAFHTLGRFECTGRVSIDGMPKSCKDLWVIGYTLSGLYSIKGSNHVELVYCDFNQLPNDLVFQTWIGYQDIKSMPIYFYVQKNTTSSTSNTSLPFEVEKINVGKAMNLTSGVFTAPRTGKYLFSFSGIGRFPPHIYGFVNVGLMLNGKQIGRGDANSEFEHNNWKTYSLQSILHLRVGDQVWVQISSMLNSYLMGNEDHYTHFTGWLLQEDIFKTHGK